MITDNIAVIEIKKMQQCDIKQTLAILLSEKLENWNYEDFASEIKRMDSIVLVAIINNQQIGFCLARLIMPESCFNYQKNHLEICTDSYAISEFKKKISQIVTECEIYNFAVKKEFQNQGIGKLLLNYLIEMAKKYNAVSCWLEVRYSNKQAIDFYQKNNFNKVYERKNFYSNPVENAIVMKRNLEIIAMDKISSHT